MKAFATAVFVAASAAAFAQQPNQSTSSQQPNQSSATQPNASRQQQQPSTAQQMTVTGCLTSAQNVFTLTANDSQPGASTPTTVSYTLQPSGSVDLKSHVNHKVEIKGAETATQGSARVVDSSRSQGQPTGTSGNNANGGNANGKTPTVETTAKAQIVAKTLTVSSVREVAAQCDPIAK